MDVARNDPQVMEVERFVCETAIKLGVAPRIELQNLEEVPYYLDMGVQHFRIGNDLTILQQYWSDQGPKLRDMLENA